MPGLPTFDGDNIDLYRQLLADAQRLEDTNMARMIRRRIWTHQRDRSSRQTEEGIIPFPGPIPVAGVPLSDGCFWKNDRFWSDLIQFLVLLCAGLTWITLPFILSAVLHL